MSGPCEAIVEAIFRDEIEPLKERNAKLVAAFMLKLREENECNGPCADNQKCGCWAEMQIYVALATEKP